MLRGCQSEVAPIRGMLLKHARDAFRSQQVIEGQWRGLRYAAPPRWDRAVEEYDRFVELLQGFGIEIQFLPADPGAGLDSIYIRDAVVLCEKGAILCNMGKLARRAEPKALEAALRERGSPVLGAIRGEGRLEGGDVVWLDSRTLAVGRGYRTNDGGIAQLREMLGDVVDELLVVPLPHHRGPNDVFHLMSIISPLDTDLALVHSPLMPVPFREALLRRGIGLLEVPEQEFASMGCNVLTVAPRCCVALGGNPRTRALLEGAGVEVHDYDGAEISVKGTGGPTCLTRPLSRGLV